MKPEEINQIFKKTKQRENTVWVKECSTGKLSKVQTDAILDIGPEAGKQKKEADRQKSIEEMVSKIMREK